MSFTRRIVAPVLIVSTLFAAGCSSDDDSDDSVDLNRAPQAQWSSLGGIQAPTSSEDGPSSDEPVIHGYSQTPQGAVLSAINGQTQLATASDDEWVQVANTLLSPGKGKDQWVQARALQTISGEVDDPAQFVCFKVTDFTEDRAQVVLTVQWPDGEKTAQPSQLAWQGGDWRLVLPDQGNAPDAVVVNNLDDCTEFSAETDS